MPDLAMTHLDDLAVISVRGPDTVPFLQGQLSQDIGLLAACGSQLAGLHNPQGRCLAVLRLLHLAADQVLVVLPTDLAQPVCQTLTRYVLRAKVKLEDVGSTWRVYGITGPDADAAASTRLHMPMDASGTRQLVVAPRGEPAPQSGTSSRDSWRLDDIASGVPELGAATSGQFVAQMLNLDLLGAIAFNKGCYTGQEVIARAHFRGQVKRRMQRFFTATETLLAPGSRIVLADGRRAQIVMAAPAEGGGQEFLAVAASAGEVAGSNDYAAVPEAGLANGALAVSILPLPYVLPT
jgi:folate-binding protein YgfZ